MEKFDSLVPALLVSGLRNANMKTPEPKTGTSRPVPPPKGPPCFEHFKFESLSQKNKQSLYHAHTDTLADKDFTSSICLLLLSNHWSPTNAHQPVCPTRTDCLSSWAQQLAPLKDWLTHFGGTQTGTKANGHQNVNFSKIRIDFLSLSISFSQFDSVSVNLISFNQFDSVKNAGID